MLFGSNAQLVVTPSLAPLSIDVGLHVWKCMLADRHRRTEHVTDAVVFVSGSTTVTIRRLFWRACLYSKTAVREAATICPRPLQVDFDLLTLKVVSQSRVTWATSVPILVSVLDLGPIIIIIVC